MLGRSPCGERGLKLHRAEKCEGRTQGRSPCGERGLKSYDYLAGCDGAPSLPVRGAWIEILSSSVRTANPRCRSPCGERGLKYFLPPLERQILVVAPRAGSVD